MYILFREVQGKRGKDFEEDMYITGNQIVLSHLLTLDFVCLLPNSDRRILTLNSGSKVERSGVEEVATTFPL